MHAPHTQSHLCVHGRNVRTNVHFGSGLVPHVAGNGNDYIRVCVCVCACACVCACVCIDMHIPSGSSPARRRRQWSATFFGVPRARRGAVTGARRSAATRCECAYPWVPLAACRKQARARFRLAGRRAEACGRLQRGQARAAPRRAAPPPLGERHSARSGPSVRLSHLALSHLALSHLALSHLALSHLACPSSPVPLLLRWLSSISPLPTVRQAALRHWAASLPPLACAFPKHQRMLRRPTQHRVA